jgi:hypothetical protein
MNLQLSFRYLQSITPAPAWPEQASTVRNERAHNALVQTARLRLNFAKLQGLQQLQHGKETCSTI